MKKYTIETIKRVLRGRRYVFYNGPFNINLICIRSLTSKSDSFDDLCTPIWQDLKGDTHIEYFPCTTDPGKHWLLNPLNPNGTIITVPGQYRSSHKLGLHNRSKPQYIYEALEQCGDMRYVRDNNRDSNLDFSLMDDPANYIIGNFKTNIHRASAWKRLLNVNRYSAGCTVLQSPWDFEKIIKLAKAQERNGYGNKFTYTLLDEKWF